MKSKTVFVTIFLAFIVYVLMIFTATRCQAQVPARCEWLQKIDTMQASAIVVVDEKTMYLVSKPVPYIVQIREVLQCEGAIVAERKKRFLVDGKDVKPLMVQ